MVSSGLVSNGNFNRLRVNAVNVNNTTNSLLNIKKGVIYEHYSRQVIQEYKYNLDSNLLKNINESEKIQTDGKLEITNVLDIGNNLLIRLDIVDNQLGKYSHNINWVVDKQTGNCTGVSGIDYDKSYADFNENGDTLTVISTIYGESFTKTTINIWKIN